MAACCVLLAARRALIYGSLVCIMCSCCASTIYSRAVKCPLPAEWSAVSDDAKIDYVFNMFVAPQMIKLQWDATNGKMSPDCQFESWTDGGCAVMKTTGRRDNAIAYVQYSAYEPKRTGPRSMTISEYNVRLRSDFPATDLDAATIKSRSLSNMFRHVEASIAAQSVTLHLTVDTPKMPSDSPACCAVCFCCFLEAIKVTVQSLYDASMDAIEADFQQRRLAAPIDAGDVMALPVFEAQLPIAQAIAIVPIQMVQVVTTTTTVTGDPMTGVQWVTTTQTVTTATTTMAVPVGGKAATIVPVAQAVEAVPVAQSMERDGEPRDWGAQAMVRQSPMDGRMMEATSGCYVQREAPWMYFYLSFNEDHSKYSMGPGGCCLVFNCPYPGACGVHEAQAASSSIFATASQHRTDRWQSPRSFVRTRAVHVGARETFIKVC